MDLPVVWFLDRRALRLGAVREGGSRTTTVVDDDGETHKLRDGRTLHRLAARVPAAREAPALRDHLRRLRTDLARRAARFDPTRLDELKDDASHSLADLARLTTGDAGDLGVAGLIAGLGGSTDDWIGHGLRIEQGSVVRLPRATREKIRAQREAEARQRAEEEGLLAWFAPRRDLPGGLAGPPPAEAALAWDGLVTWALAGDRAPPAERARQLARRLGLDEPDALLAALERGGAVARDVNEQPARAGLPVAFGAAVAAEAAALAASPLEATGEGLLDLRGRPTFAIDDPGTVEVDDALSVWEADGATWLAVHIASVGDLVPPGGPVDREARRRATSVYFPEGSIPMLPGALVPRLSLEAGVDRRGLSLVARVGPDGRLVEPRFAASLIRVTRRLAYEAWTDASGDDAARALALVRPVVEAARDERRRQGASILALPFLKLRVGEDGEPEAKLARSDTPAYATVSELMVLYNAELGRALAAAGLPALYRTQPRPVKRPACAPEDPLFSPLSRRGMPPSIVAGEPAPHRTLGVPTYVQGSSPIRRYGDLLAQRQLLAHLAGRPAPHSREDVEAARVAVEAAEKRAGRAQDERERYWLCRWLAGRREPLEGWISRAEPGRAPQAWIPSLDRELPVAEPRRAVAVGDAALLRVARCAPRARSVVLELLLPAGPPGVDSDG